MEYQNNELEVMSRQLDILNKKLEDQEIVNDRLMREAMKGRMSWIKKFIWCEIVAVPFVIFLFFVITVGFKLSFGPFVLMSVMLVADVALDYKINKIGDNDFLQGNLTETAIKLIKMKKMRSVELAAELPIIIIWAVWFSVDIFWRIPDDELMHDLMTGFMIGSIIGGILGLVVVFVIMRKMQRTNDDVIRQIQELSKEE